MRRCSSINHASPTRRSLTFKTSFRGTFDSCHWATISKKSANRGCTKSYRSKQRDVSAHVEPEEVLKQVGVVCQTEEMVPDGVLVPVEHEGLAEARKVMLFLNPVDPFHEA